jgi:molybdopterin-guanine dinucleotide biosynthesis protein
MTHRVAGFLTAIGIGMAPMPWTPNALADTLPCTTQESQSAEAVAAKADTWAELHALFERYGHCDDGAIAEGFSDSVTALLAEHWSEIPQLESTIRADAAFRKFVLRHIDESIPDERLMRIQTLAREQCAEGAEELCRAIVARVTAIGPCQGDSDS